MLPVGKQTAEHIFLFMPQTLSAPAHSEIIIRKSRFIGCVMPIADRASAQAEVLRLRHEHPAAAHVCWALLAGGDSAAVDDGEPGGTAGRPMLAVLRHHDLDGVLATVVRYFGGVKLGAGGLVRAYTDAVAQVLQTAPKVQLQRQQTLCCSVPFALEGLLRREITQAGATLRDVQHGSLVVFHLSMPAPAAAAFVTRLNDVGQGRVGWIDTTA